MRPRVDFRDNQSLSAIRWRSVHATHRLHHIPNFQVLSLSTLSVFECANMLAPEPLYDLRILSETGGPIRTSSGLTLETERFDKKEFDTLIVLGTLVDEPTFSPGLLAYVRNAPQKARRVASICTGALVLAEAGLLDDRRVSDRADSGPDDPRPRNQEQRFLRCRDPREAEEISVGANPLSASQRNLLHKGDR